VEAETMLWGWLLRIVAITLAVAAAVARCISTLAFPQACFALLDH